MGKGFHIGRQPSEKEHAMFRRRILAVVCVGLIPLLALVARAGERGPGKYCGTVIYDRWGGCTLYSGIYVMYLSEAVKEKVRAHAGKSVEIDAKQVDQPQNPGDGLIKQLAFVGPAPPTQNWVALEDLSLRVAPALADDGRPRLSISLQNTGAKEVEVFCGEFAPTLLTKRAGKQIGGEPADGPSFAMITRLSFRVGAEARTSGRWWGIDAALPHKFMLQPQERRVVTITFELPEGEYDFLAGYGGGVHAGKGIASNLVAFDVSAKGKAKHVKVKGR
jgi:hypothetical protein